ncbi:uncharacterized protein LOC131596225 [Vicia villosa]|uniref:uncharacterized protein LOC131596225 n=1 Tax=Vicia villosa TaxID=3911 RepID=UPI00273BC3BA|nr:uncharacterized protein LOC131596225 [Vicia villosa]
MDLRAQTTLNKALVGRQPNVMQPAKRGRTKTTSVGPHGTRPREPNTRRFLGPSQKARFAQLASRTILPEKLVVPKDQSEYNMLWSYFEHRKWDRVFDPYKEVNMDIVREFYANAIKLTPYTIAYNYETFVRGHTIRFDRQAVSEFLGNPLELPEGEKCYYRKHLLKTTHRLDDVSRKICIKGKGPVLGKNGAPIHCHRKNLNIDARAVLTIMSYNIRPWAHVTTIPMDATLLIRVLVSRHSVDIALR